MLLGWVAVITIHGLMQPVGCRLNMPAWHSYGMELLFTWSPTSMNYIQKRINFPLWRYATGICHTFLALLAFSLQCSLSSLGGYKDGVGQRMKFGKPGTYIWFYAGYFCWLQQPRITWEDKLCWVTVFTSLICQGLSWLLIGVGGSILLCAVPFLGPKFLYSMREREREASWVRNRGKDAFVSVVLTVGKMWVTVVSSCLDFLSVVASHGIVKQRTSSSPFDQDS